jgi:hypothetical protein
MVIWITKFIHVAAIAIWAWRAWSRRRSCSPSGGATTTRPSTGCTGWCARCTSRSSRRRPSRRSTGIALIFLRDIFFVWFTTKLYFVAVLVACHVGMGFLISSTFEPDGRFGPTFAQARSP